MIALLIDIGNSRIKWRIARVGNGHRRPQWLSEEQALASSDANRMTERMTGSASIEVDAIFVSNVSTAAIENAVLSATSEVWRDAEVHRLRPLAAQCGVINGYREPSQLGPDRWLAMIGAHAHEPQRTVLVCSFGTATTLDLLVHQDVPDSPATFVGGLILPGFEAMRAALSLSTARLPLADGKAVDFADNTDDAITGGIVAAQVGAVERAWRQASAGKRRDTTVCLLAGGGAASVAPFLTELDVAFEVVHDLVLRGIAAVASQANHTESAG